MSESEPSFECVSGELLWGQLHCLAEGHLAAVTDSPTAIPNILQGGTILQRNYQYRVKAVKGQWNVGQINSRSEYDTSMFIAGFVVYHSASVDPISIVKSCADVGISHSQEHNDKSIVYINRYDWSWGHNIPENVQERLYNGISDEQQSQMFQMFGQRLILVDVNFALEVIDQLKESSYNIVDKSTLIKEPIAVDNKRIGIHLHCPHTEYELGWMVFNSQKELIAFVYDGSYTNLEGELYMNDSPIRSANEWQQILNKIEKESTEATAKYMKELEEKEFQQIANILNNCNSKSIDEIVHELLTANSSGAELRSERFESFRSTVENWEQIINKLEEIQSKN